MKGLSKIAKKGWNCSKLSVNTVVDNFHLWQQIGDNRTLLETMLIRATSLDAVVVRTGVITSSEKG